MPGSPEGRDSLHSEMQPETAGRPKSGLCLEILKGKTRFPERPVNESRFLIGSAATCDLRLGGNDMPPLHSIITREGDEYWLEVVAIAPPLWVNGLRTTRTPLTEDCLIRIGSIELVARFSAASILLDGDTSPAQTLEVGSDLAALSPLELVDLIEQQVELVDDFDLRCTQGALSLLEIARQNLSGQSKRSWRHDSPASGLSAPHGLAPAMHDPQFGPEIFAEKLHEIGNALLQMAGHLQASQQVDRDARQALMAQMLDAQHLLACQIDAVLSELEAASLSGSGSHSGLAIA